MMLSSSRSFALACLCLYFYGVDYPAYHTAQTFAFSWMCPIFVRNIIATWVICGGWDYTLYLSPIKDKFKPYKFHEEIPTFAQMKHDAFQSTIATCFGSLVEILLCYLYANKVFILQATLSENILYSLFWCCIMKHFREIHFYASHRMMHPWRIKGIPDVGRFLYKHFHSLHHKSYNTTSFSGTNMQAVDAFVYYSAAMMVMPFRVPMAIPLATLFDCAIGAWTGHSGFEFPGTGGLFHDLHHTTFDCNFGTQGVPLDWFFGTFSSCPEDT
jgi:Delta7-sterol 5-desaturase